MIAHLSGTVTAAGPTWLIIDVGGVGIRTLCPPATAAAVRVGETSTLITSLVVREDSLTLYGFSDDEARDAFELVQTASGVGPKLAQAIVSVLNPQQLRTAIQTENLAALCAVPGIGRKGAQKLVIELKDRIQVLAVDATAEARTGHPAPVWREQVSAGLQGLGWSGKDAESACDRVAAAQPDAAEMPVAQLMRTALASLARS